MPAVPGPVPPSATPIPVPGPAPAEAVWAPSGPGTPSQTPTVEAAAIPVAPVSESSSPSTHRSLGSFFGLGLDAGLPDGAYLSFVVRPLSQLRLHVAGGTNTAGAGFRGGLTAIPYWFWFVAPSLSLEAGWCRVGDVNSVITTFFQVPGWMKEYAQQAGYTYYNGHLGIEIGKSWLTWFVHLGVSYVSGVVRMPRPVLLTGVNNVPTDTSPEVVLGRDANIQVITISGKTGLVVHFGGL
jgi:hypothetical protein